MQFSEEQREIGQKASQNYNLIIDAVAGSGKTTTIIHLGQCLPDKKILALLYNRQLADEIQEKINQLTTNITVRTIHSFSQWYYHQPCFSDEGLDQIVHFEKSPVKSHQYDLVIVDEAQDVYPVTARIIRKIFRDLQQPQRIFMGDYRQCINQFRESDSRYLLNADELFPDPTREWRRLTLSKTFRCTESMVKFVNYCLKDPDHMVAVRSTGQIDITYWLTDLYNPDFQKLILSEIRNYFEMGYQPDDLAFISYSLKAYNNPICRIANKLSTQGVDIYKPLSDDSEIRDDRLIAGKVVFSTIHQFKGRQRKIVFLVGFDCSLYKYFNGNQQDHPDVCPNRLYVALTRATDHLHLFHHYRNDYLRFVEPDQLDQYVNRILSYQLDIREVSPKLGRVFSVKDLIKHLPYRLVKQLKGFYEIRPRDRLGRRVNLEKIVRFSNGFQCIYEDISAIYGTMVPMIYWNLPFHRNPITTFLRDFLQQSDAVNPAEADIFGILDDLKEMEEIYSQILVGLNRLRNNLPQDVDYATLGLIANAYNCCRDGYLFPLRQIQNYQFCQHTRKINQFIDNMRPINTLEYTPEKFLKYTTVVHNLMVSIVGATDAINQEILWEFKCVNQLTDNHILQLLVYACMDYCQHKTLRSYRIYNIQTGEVRELFLKDPTRAGCILRKIIRNRVEISTSSKSLNDLIEELVI